MKRALTIVFVISLSLGLKISAQTTTENSTDQNKNISESNSTFLDFGNGVEAPADFPRFVNTGNTELDQQNYSNAKAKWISENQDLYNSLVEKIRLNIDSINENSNSENNKGLIKLDYVESNNTLMPSGMSEEQINKEIKKYSTEKDGYFVVSEKTFLGLSQDMQSYISTHTNVYTIQK